MHVRDEEDKGWCFVGEKDSDETVLAKFITLPKRQKVLTLHHGRPYENWLYTYIQPKKDRMVGIAGCSGGG